MNKPYVTAVDKEIWIMRHIRFWGTIDEDPTAQLARCCKLSLVEAQKWIDYSKYLDLKKLLMRRPDGTT